MVEPESGGAPRRRGRRPAGEDARGEILAAAREEFAAKGYDGATLRGIARRAGVDPRLVHHYFASGREELFAVAMNLPDVPSRLIPRMIAAGPREELGERLVRFVLTLWDGDARQTLVGLIRTAASGPEGAKLLRQFLAEVILRRLVEAAGADDPELRAALVAAHLAGVALLRYVLEVEPVASADIEDLAALMGPTVQRYLVG